MADLVARADAGDRAAKNALFAALYGELHRLAHSHVQRSAGHLTLITTTLLHEAYLDITRRDGLAFGSRERFLPMPPAPCAASSSATFATGRP